MHCRLRLLVLVGLPKRRRMHRRQSRPSPMQRHHIEWHGIAVCRLYWQTNEVNDAQVCLMISVDSAQRHKVVATRKNFGNVGRSNLPQRP